MTVSYNSDVSSVSSTNFFRLLLRWKGSIWKSVSSELAIWSFSYFLVALLYHYFLFPHNLYEAFNDVAYYCGKELHNYIPLTFMLAFFVSIIVERWRSIFSNMGWIESAALTLNVIIVAKCEEAKLIKRNIVRCLVLAQILSFRDISIRVRRRFPNIDSIMKAGFLTEEENEKLENIDLAYNKYWAPVNWALYWSQHANSQGYVLSPPGMIHLITEIKNFRNGLGKICNYDWVPIPIAYPQVVFFAVRIYFIICLVTRQYIRVPNKDFEPVQLFIRPAITIIEFICIVGWMKVAEALLNPLGEDDDDFESNFLIDKNIFTGMKIIDDYDNAPSLFEDHFSDPGAVPIYSADSQKYQANGALVGSVSNVTLAQFDENITMVPVAPRLSVGDITTHEHLRPSLRRRYKSGGSSHTFSRANSVRDEKIQRQNSHGENNDGYELDYDPNTTDMSPTRHGKFFTNLTKVDEKEEDSPPPSKSSVVSRV